jgi:hypothetical protein
VIVDVVDTRTGVQEQFDDVRAGAPRGENERRLSIAARSESFRAMWTSVNVPTNDERRTAAAVCAVANRRSFCDV